jgi:hypothetical protein
LRGEREQSKEETEVPGLDDELRILRIHGK